MNFFLIYFRLKLYDLITVNGIIAIKLVFYGICLRSSVKRRQILILERYPAVSYGQRRKEERFAEIEEIASCIGIWPIQLKKYEIRFLAM